MRFAFIHEHRACWPAGVMCRVLGVSRSGYFAWRGRSPSRRTQRREQLLTQVVAVYEANRRVYGSPRVHRLLLARGVRVCVNTVARLMRLAGLAAQKKRRYVPRTTDSVMTRRPGARQDCGKRGIHAARALPGVGGDHQVTSVAIGVTLCSLHRMPRPFSRRPHCLQ